MYDSGSMRKTMTRSTLLAVEKRRADLVKARKASAAGSHTRGKALEAAKDEIAAYLARVPEPL